MYTCVCFKCPEHIIVEYIRQHPKLLLQEVIDNLILAKRCQLCLTEIKRIYMEEKQLTEFDESLDIPKKHKNI